MMSNAPESAPESPPGPLPGSDLLALYRAAQTENQSMQIRIDALRASLGAIARGATNPCFAAAKALSRDDDLLAACRIARGLVR